MKFLVNIFFLLCFLPYIKIIPKLDTQPGALVIGSFLSIIFIQYRINKKLITILILCFSSILFFDFKNPFLSLRGILNYYSLAIITYATYRGLYSGYKFINTLKIIINLWFICGFIQTFFKRNFLYFLLNSMRTSETRGVTSLAPEPTFYGIVCIFFMILVIETFEDKKILYILNLLIQIIFFSKSSMAILFLIIWLFLFMLKKINLKKLIILLGSLIAIDFIIKEFLIGTRINSLYLRSKDLKELFYKDHSLNARLSHIFYSLKGAFDNGLVPNGFVSWNNYSYLESLEKIYFHTFGPSSSGRIMSGYGAVIYEMGILGIVVLIQITFILYTGLKYKENVIFLSIILFSAIQMSNPLIGTVLGLALYNLGEIKHAKIKNNDCCRNKT